jgi:UDP-N-acetylmuramate dehydrogenase
MALPHRRDVPFARLTTLGLGGICRWLFEPVDEDQATRFTRACHREGLPYRVLGGGSNLVVLGDVSVPVLRLRFPADVRREGTSLEVPASFGHTRLSETAAEAGLSGLEHAAGIPGTCGGALCMNAGAHGHDLAEVLERYRFLTPEGELVDRRPEPGEFGYRASALRHQGLALGLRLRLAAGDPTRIRETMAAHRARREATQPLATSNAGCIFKNPPGEHAGRLIEGAGLRGLRVGQAQVSPLHANFLVNLGGAGPQEFRELLDLVRGRVREATGHLLELEVEVWESAP